MLAPPLPSCLPAAAPLPSPATAGTGGLSSSRKPAGKYTPSFMPPPLADAKPKAFDDDVEEEVGRTRDKQSLCSVWESDSLLGSLWVGRCCIGFGVVWCSRRGAQAGCCLGGHGCGATAAAGDSRTRACLGWLTIGGIVETRRAAEVVDVVGWERNAGTPSMTWYCTALYNCLCTDLGGLVLYGITPDLRHRRRLLLCLHG